MPDTVLLESGSRVLLEDGSSVVLLESAQATTSGGGFVLLEDGTSVLQEDGSHVLLEGGTAVNPGPPVVDAVIGQGPDVIAAAVAWWNKQPAMRALTSDGLLWHKVAPEDVALPYCTIFLVSESAEIWTTAYPFERSSVQINCHASTDLEARHMGLVVRRAMLRAPLVIGTQDVCHVLPDGSGIDVGEGLGPGGKDCWVAFETFDIPWTP